MEVYHRIAERVKGAMWAHHRKLMPERQFQRILGYVYNNKYEYQIRLDQMLVVGKEWGGKVEVATTPAGHIKRVRVNPSFQDLPVKHQHALLLAAYSDAVKQGRVVMEEAEMRVYKQFMADIKPLVMGIRDNPEFYTVAEDTVETFGGTLKALDGKAASEVHRTIPYGGAVTATDLHRQKELIVKDYMSRRPKWNLPHKLVDNLPESRPRGAPGAKKSVAPFELRVPYTPMDETRLLRKNWMAFLDNKHVAEATWTKVKIGDREKMLREQRRTGQVWHTSQTPTRL